MLTDVEQMAKTAKCPCCERRGDFSVLLNFSFRDKECTITCMCNHCQNIFEVESNPKYVVVDPALGISDAA